MRKFILPAALVALSFVALPKAHAADGNGWYANASVGSNHFKASASAYGYNVSLKDTTTSSMFNVGWHKGMIGFEAGYVDLGSVKYSDGMGDSAKISADGFTAGINLHYNVNEHFYISGRTGAFFWHSKASATVYDPYYATSYSASASDSSTSWYGGVGAGYDFNSHWGIGANYNYYRISKSGVTVDSDMYMGTIEYRF